MGEIVSESQKNKGQYFTPITLVQGIIKLTSKFLNKQISDLLVLDPATGEGIFPLELLHLLKGEFSGIHIDALDLDPLVLETAETVVLSHLRKNDTINFIHTNFLANSFRADNKEAYHLVIGNPPHNAKYTDKEWANIHKMSQEYITSRIPSESAIYFVLKSIQLLKKDGILSFILPKPFCYSNRWKSFRKVCFEKFCILAVIDLSNQFSGQLQEQVVIILRKSDSCDSFLTGVLESGNIRISSQANI